MIQVSAAEQLLDFGARLGPGGEQRAREQLEGAVAIHNILEKEGVAYLADEVGMGKTIVALGALALFRHFNPSFRVLVIAPRENIQRKWQKELLNFVEHNVRFSDLRVRALDGKPARPLVHCENLVDLLGDATLDPNRDFFARLTSFSFGLRGRDLVDPDAAREVRRQLREHLPWLSNEVFDLRDKAGFKDNIAMAVCCGLPVFDLVVVDEGHNLKHGFKEWAAARNRVLALVFGHPTKTPARDRFPGYGLRARRVLFLSATPIEETYRHLWNQLDVFGKGRGFEDLLKPELSDESKKTLVRRFLVRRVTSIRVAGHELTKNLYRREWRAGGVAKHDDPIAVSDDRQRLIVALVQKKVSEILGSAKFNRSFQIGMLASFESFIQTAGVRRTEEGEEASNFDDTDQTTNELEREGVDVRILNRMAGSYRRTFGTELPHPKMDAVALRLATAWERGEKALLFVRRVASVKELKRKLDECYDDWLLGQLHQRLPQSVEPRLREIEAQYREEKHAALERNRDEDILRGRLSRSTMADRGGFDTFFAWFFRGEGPSGVVSGANIQKRFVSSRGAFGTFFEDNHVADLLGCRPGGVFEALTEVLSRPGEVIRGELQDRGRRYLSRAKRHPRADRFEAAQAAAVELLKETPGPLQSTAAIVFDERFCDSLKKDHADASTDLTDTLETHTFFTELRLRRELCSRLWPEPTSGDPRARFRDRELRAQLLAAAARLGHAFIDLYALIIERLGSIEARAQEGVESDDEAVERARIESYLDMLDRQRATPRSERTWSGYDELADIAANFDLILDVNEPSARSKPLSQTARSFGSLLREQQPVGGMYASVNATLVRQFRMPGYPLVLVSTDLLQEGEDLHTFCSEIHHYGISWTPSAMEQRTGRVDRVRSATDRRLSALDHNPTGDEKLQVHYPYLGETVEVLQVSRVLERVDRFLRLMHEGLQTTGNEERRIVLEREMRREIRMPQAITTSLKTAFPVPGWALGGSKVALCVGPEFERSARERFERLRRIEVPGLPIEWAPGGTPGVLVGTAHLGDRRQMFRATLASVEDWLAVRCTSPIGRVSEGADLSAMRDAVAKAPIQIVLAEVGNPIEWSLACEEEVLLAEEEHDAARVAWLVGRVVRAADRLEHEHWEGADHPPDTLAIHFLEGADAD